MGLFTVRTCYPQDVTVLSNIFLDHYMPKANGEFVKIYLFLLRSSGNGGSASLPAIADALNCTETDVFRALKYWHEEGVISLACSADGKNIEGITIVNFCGPLPGREEQPAPDKETLQNEIPEKTLPDKTPEPKDLSIGRIRELSAKSEVQEFLFIAEQYMGHPLTRTELEKILFFYDSLHFSSELIDYLLEYCISSNHSSIRYIEKVALAWYDSGVRTIDDARTLSADYAKDYYEITKALGMTSPLTKTHLSIIDKWRKDWGFSTDVIREACSRTVLSTTKPSLAYADRILDSWHKNEVRSVEDIRKLDGLHREMTAKKKNSENNSAAARPRKNNGNFYNFEQRSYDYKSLEARLLGTGAAD
ncbi:MAG: DnaD domain protein [Lachnospiraceae bacterium]|nr:DnaD domain protein [Lachnospiraceae bacterium]